MTARVNTYLDGIKSLEISQPFKCLIMLSLRTIADFCYVSLVIMLASFLPSFSSLADPDLHESSFVVLLGVLGGGGGCGGRRGGIFHGFTENVIWQINYFLFLSSLVHWASFLCLSFVWLILLLFTNDSWYN